MSANVQLQGNTLPAVKIIDLNITVAFNQIIQITNQEFASSRDAQFLVSVGLLTELSGPPVTPTVVNLSDIDPQTFNIRPGKVELEDCSPDLATMIVEGGASRSFLWTIDPDFKVNTGTLTFGNGQLVQAGVPYNLTAGSIGPALGDRTIIGTLDIGAHTVTLRYDVATYIPTTNEVIVGTYDITKDEIILTEQTAQEAKDILYNNASSNGLFTTNDVQATLDQLGAYFTGLTPLPIMLDFTTIPGASFIMGSDIILNTIATHKIRLQDTGAHFLDFYFDGVASPNEAVIDASIGGSVFNKLHVIGNNGMLFDLTGASGSTIIAFKSPAGIVRSIGTGIQLINTAQDQNIMVLGADNLNTPTQAQITVGDTLPLFIHTSNGGQFGNVQIDPTQIQWTNGVDTFFANQNGIKWMDSITTFQVTDSGVQWTTSGSHFVASDSQINWGSGAALFHADGTELQWTPDGTTQFIVSNNELFWQDALNTEFTANDTELFYNSPTGNFEFAVNNSELFYNSTTNNFQLAVNNNELFWTNGSQNFEVSPSELSWFGSQASFIAEAGDFFYQDNNSGASFEADSSQFHYESDSTPTCKFFLTPGNFFTNGIFGVNPFVLQFPELDINAPVVQRTQALADFPTGGNIGTAAATVDVDSSFNVPQTTAGQTLTLPAPTVTTAGRIAYVNNTGSTSFTMLGKVLPNGAGLIAMWNGTAWSLMGFGG